MIQLDQLIALTTATGKNIDMAARTERLQKAIDLGASDATLKALAEAYRTGMGPTIILPAHKYENLSRGKGWCRKGRGDSATWGEREAKGYRVGPGRWTVGGNDGFSRKGETLWDVEHVQVGSETWTVAN